MDASETRALAVAALASVWELVDRQLSPLGLRAIEKLALRPCEIALDIGCGAGETLLQLAQRVGPDGRVVGVDIAAPLLDIAGCRSAHLRQVELIEADAQTLDLPTGSVDAVFSRFGVMQFADPVAAFANFHRLLRPSGRLAFVCWRALAENELDAWPLAAAGLAEHANPTPFSFADPDHLESTLKAAGFRDVALRPHDEPVSAGDLEQTLQVLLKVGALGRIVRENPTLRIDAEARLRRAFGETDSAAVSLDAAIWIVSARA